ncbi:MULTISPECIES: hypothetical protein [unclassified Endozoicomonas]|uniref:hypothetical protein n=1 Tax=unclassified Endozoicomonas TaxID=2644528 RepID=UPI003BB6A2DF
MNNTISVFEHDFLSTRIESDRCRRISKASFDPARLCNGAAGEWIIIKARYPGPD